MCNLRSYPPSLIFRRVEGGHDTFNWSRNNAYETLRSYWLISTSFPVKKLRQKRDFSEDEYSAALVEALRNFHYDSLKVEQIECLQWVLICLCEDIFGRSADRFRRGRCWSV